MADDVALEDPAVELEPETPVDSPVEPAPVPLAPDRSVLALWLPTPSRRRLIDADLEIVDDIADRPSLILASTRGPAARRSSIKSMVDEAPVVVVCHPGGERAAAEMVGFGAVAIVAEGSEANAIRVLDSTPGTHLIDAYRSEIDRSWAGGSAFSVDPVTGLPTTSGFELRLAELAKNGGMPRLGLVDMGLEGALRQIGPSGQAIMKRRLAVAVVAAAGHRGAEVFDLGPILAALSADMPARTALALGREIVDIGFGFTPSGDPLDLAVGWAGPEAASDTVSLRLLAERALEVAKAREARVVDAEELSKHSAATIELTAVYGVADAVDAADRRGNHSERVSDYTTDLARELQLEPTEIAEVGLAARLHDVGKAIYGADAFDSESERFEEARTLHPERGERFVLSSAGSVVAAIIRSHHESWDGTGFPDGITANEIPMGARILAVAHMYDELAISGTPQAEIEERLRAEGSVTLDPDLVEAAIALFGQG